MILRTEDGSLKIKTSSLSDNGTLFTAVIVSLILAGILSIVGLFALFYVLYEAFTSFSKDSAHISKYADKYNKTYLKQKDTGDADEDTKVFPEKPP